MSRRKDKPSNAAAKTVKTCRVIADEPTAFDRFGVLLEEAQKFCEGVGLHKDLIGQIFKTDSDWAFLLKIDALLEAASKEIIRHALRLKILNRVIQGG
jgi:hypothetical protein